MELVPELARLEEAMWRPETRNDPAWMDEHLAAAFVEFGRSGRRSTRAEIVDVSVGDISAVVRDMVMRPLGDRHVLVTYQSETNGMVANRSSIWHRTPTGWLMEFHQGTPVDAEHS